MSYSSPWNGLVVGGVDSRRMDQFSKWNFFWAVMPKSDPAFVLVLASLPSQLPKLPKLKNLEAGFTSLTVGPAFYLRLKDPSQAELFESLCRDIGAAAADALSEDDALRKVLGRTNRWHHLLRGGRVNALSEEEQRGLIGELSLLTWLATTVGAESALLSWRGPLGSPKDFEMHGHCIEVKGRRAAAQPFVQISNEFQLADVEAHRTWLRVFAVDKVGEPFGETLHDVVQRVGSAVCSDAAALWQVFEEALAASGYRPEDNYVELRWLVADGAWFEVRPGFPRIELPLSGGVSQVRYSLALSACEPFRVNEASVAKTIGGDD